MIALEVADLVLIASRTLGLDTGQVLDLVDVAAAENALAAAQPAQRNLHAARPSAPPPCCTPLAAPAAAAARQPAGRAGGHAAAIPGHQRLGHGPGPARARRRDGRRALAKHCRAPGTPRPCWRASAATLMTSTTGHGLRRPNEGEGTDATTTGAVAPPRKNQECAAGSPGGRGCTPADSPSGTNRQSTCPWKRPGNWVTTTLAPSICSSACSARETALPSRCWHRWASPWRR